MLSIRALALILALAVASPVPNGVETDVQKRAPNCKAANVALTVLKALGPPATAFCSSYLHIPATITSVTTATTPTVTETISTATVTEGQCPGSEALRRRDERSFTIERTDHYIDRRSVAKPLEKRVNIPALSNFAASKLSSACSCLSLAPKTVVSTFTPSTKTISAVATETACATCNPRGGHCTANTYLTDCCAAPEGTLRCDYLLDPNDGYCDY